MIKNIEDETLSNIENHIEEQDRIIANLLKVCKEANSFIKKLSKMGVLETNSNSGLDWDMRYKLPQAINEAERKG